MRFQPLQTALLAAIFAAMPAARAATTLFDNLAAAQHGNDPLLSTGPLADSFSTGAQAGLVLTQVSALLKSQSADVVGDLRVSLHADGPAGPGAWLSDLGTLSSAAVSTSAFGVYTFTPAAAVALAAHTTYWVEIEAVAPNAVLWSWSRDISGTGVAGGANYSALFGVSPNASNADFGPYQMSVVAQAVPEPATAALMLGGAGLLAGVRRRKA